MSEQEMMDWKYKRCKSHLKKVYETECCVFMKCQKPHRNKDSFEQPVFMIRKEVKQS